MKKTINEILNKSELIWFAYAIVIVIAVFLNASRRIQIENLAITVVMLGIVFAIFVSNSRRFKRLTNVADELDNMTEHIEAEQAKGNQLSVQDSGIEFVDPLLNRRFNKFVENYERLYKKNPLGYKGSIEEYVNYTIVDTIVSRNVTNLVAGAMTGLGILGTFIGLSLGLQSFNLTSDTDQITQSIDALMEGIKVAFHTSIYGMILSLIFNYCYKKQIEKGNNAIERFVEAYKKYIYSDKTDDSVNEFMSFQKSQAEDLHLFTQEFSNNISEIFTPQFEKMNAVITDFAEIAGQKQIEGVETMVNNFIDALNSSMGQNFNELGSYIMKYTEMQRESVEKLQTAMETSENMIANITEINETVKKTVSELEGYIAEVEELQKVVNLNLTTVNAQIETLHSENEKREEYSESLGNLEKNVIEAEKKHLETIDQYTYEMMGSIKSMADQMVESIKESATVISVSFDDYRNAITTASDTDLKALTEIRENMVHSIEHSADELKSAVESINKGMVSTSENLRMASDNLNENMDQSVKTTFKYFDENLSKIYEGLSGTLIQINSSTDRVPKVINASYDKVIDSIEKLNSVITVASDNSHNVNEETA